MPADHDENDLFFVMTAVIAVLIAIVTSVVVVFETGRGPDERGAEAGATTSTVAPAVTSTTQPRPPAPVGVSVVWSGDGSAEIRGTVQSDDQFEAVVSASAEAFGAANVDSSRLRVDDAGGVNADERIGAFVAIIDRMPSRLTLGVALLQDRRLTLSGTLAPGFETDVFDDLLASAEGAGIAVSTELVAVVELPPFERSIEISDDGLLLTGTVATAEQASELVAMLEALELGDVRDQLVVSDVSANEGAVILVGEVGEQDATRLQAMVSSGDDVTIQDELSIVSVEAGAIERLNELFALEPIRFDTAQATIRDESADTLDEAAEILSEVEGAAIRIEGHTDSQGDPDRNLELSQERAEAVLDALVARGVDPALLEARGFGESRPIADNTTDEGRQANRRIELTLLGA